MSRTMTAPWIKKSITQLLLDTNAAGTNASKKSPEKVNRICQVISTFESFRCIIISDKDFHIPVFLTDLAVDHLASNNLTIRGLNNAIVKLQIYHFSTIYQCAADRDLPAIISQIALPLAIQCSRIEYLGGDDSTIIGDPQNINKDMDGSLKLIGYINIIDRLRAKQFPSQKCLPDFAGQFTSFIRFDEENPLTLDDCLVTKDQYTFIERLPSYSHSDLVAAHAERQTQLDTVLDLDTTRSDSQMPNSIDLMETSAVNNTKPISNGDVENIDSKQRLLVGDRLEEGDQFQQTMQNLQELKSSRKMAKTAKLIEQQEESYFTQAQYHSQDQNDSQWLGSNYSQDLRELVESGALTFEDADSHAHSGVRDLASRGSTLTGSTAGTNDSEQDISHLLQPPSPHSQTVQSWAASKKKAPSKVKPSTAIPTSHDHANKQSTQLLEASSSAPSRHGNVDLQPPANLNEIATSNDAQNTPQLAVNWKVLAAKGTIVGLTSEGFTFEAEDGTRTVLSLQQLQGLMPTVATDDQAAAAAPSGIENSADSSVRAIASSTVRPPDINQEGNSLFSSQTKGVATTKTIESTSSTAHTTDAGVSSVSEVTTSLRSKRKLSDDNSRPTRAKVAHSLNVVTDDHVNASQSPSYLHVPSNKSAGHDVTAISSGSSSSETVSSSNPLSTVGEPTKVFDFRKLMRKYTK